MDQEALQSGRVRFAIDAVWSTGAHVLVKYSVTTAATLLWRLQEIVFTYKVMGVLSPERVVVIAASQGQATDPKAGVTRRKPIVLPGRPCTEVHSVKQDQDDRSGEHVRRSGLLDRERPR